MEVLRLEPVPARERGVSLVEVLAALLILSLVVVSVMTMFSHAMQLNASGADYTGLTNLAKDNMEGLLSMPYDHPSLDQAPATPHHQYYDNPDQRLHLDFDWQVAEHMINQANDDPTKAFAGDPMTSTVGPNTGNLKVITLTVATRGTVGLGQRDVTIQALKGR